MIKRVLSYGIVGLLAIALLAGTVYILLNPTEAQGQGPTGGQEQGQDHSRDWQGDVETGNGGAGAFDGSGRDSGTGQGRNETLRTVPIEWESLTGKVIAVDGDVTIQTAEGQVLIGMGQSAYREGFGLEVGDEITMLGFHEDGAFKAGTVENLTTGEMIVLRDETGRPMWSGQGRLKNLGRRPELVEG